MWSGHRHRKESAATGRALRSEHPPARQAVANHVLRPRHLFGNEEWCAAVANMTLRSLLQSTDSSWKENHSRDGAQVLLRMSKMATTQALNMHPRGRRAIRAGRIATRLRSNALLAPAETEEGLPKAYAAIAAETSLDVSHYVHDAPPHERANAEAFGGKRGKGAVLALGELHELASHQTARARATHPDLHMPRCYATDCPLGRGVRASLWRMRGWRPNL